MEHFVVNITHFGLRGCLVKELEKFDKLLRIDDDSFFKSEINFDLFDYVENNPFATGYTWSKYDYRVKDRKDLYDLDDKVVESVLLNPGDVSITFRGGHTYEIMKDNTLVYEYKTGPYLGQKFDKVFLDD